MLITTRASYRSIEDFLDGNNPLIWEGFEWRGPVVELKKGRGALNKAAGSAGQNVNNAQGTVNNTNAIAGSEVNTTGGLSPLVSKQLANEKAQIGQAYQGAAAAAKRGLAMRGMGVAPSGMDASVTNTSINNQGRAETGATGNAFATQNELNNTAYNPVIAAENAETGAVNSETGAGSALNRAGSTVGDIGTGLSGLAKIFSPGGVLGKINPYGGSNS